MTISNPKIACTPSAFVVIIDFSQAQQPVVAQPSYGLDDLPSSRTPSAFAVRMMYQTPGAFATWIKSSTQLRADMTCLAPLGSLRSSRIIPVDFSQARRAVIA